LPGTLKLLLNVDKH